MIVGLDISTSCVGVSLLNDDGSFHSIHHIELSKEKSFYKKVQAVLEFLLDGSPNLRNHDNLKFYVEEPLKMFKSNASMAQTISLLQRFNAACCFAIYWTWHIEPKLISVITARKTIGIKVPKKVNTKMFVWEVVKNELPASTWAYKKTGKPKDWCYDRADAYVISRAAYEEEARSPKENLSSS